MKVLFTGVNGKLAKRIRYYLGNVNSNIIGDFVSLRDEAEWTKLNFGIYDAVVHTAGIVSSSKDDYSEYKEINVNLTNKVFNKAVSDKSPQFIYISSMAVYDGIDWGFGEDGIITGDTKELQNSMYGKSKFEAEQAINNIKSQIMQDIKVCIVRAPAIVGKGMEDYFGRYIRLVKSGFPMPIAHYEAKRSFVYVDTLIEFIILLIESGKTGIFYPQNLPMLSVSEMLETIAEIMGKKKIKINGKLLPKKIEKRLFRQICYSMDLSLEENQAVGQISSYEVIRRVINDNG